jgi:intracellular septation protein A
MTLKDLMDIITLIAILMFGTVTLIFIRRNKLKPETWPSFIGVGSGVCLFVLLMIQSVLSKPLLEPLHYTVTNSISSLTLGIVAYFSMRMIVRGKKK